MNKYYDSYNIYFEVKHTYDLLREKLHKINNLYIYHI